MNHPVLGILYFIYSKVLDQVFFVGVQSCDEEYLEELNNGKIFKDSILLAVLLSQNRLDPKFLSASFVRLYFTTYALWFCDHNTKVCNYNALLFLCKIINVFLAKFLY